MTILVACLSTGKGTWLQVSELLKLGDWENAILLTNDFGMEKFKSEKPAEFVLINSDQPIKSLRDEMRQKLKNLIKDFEVAVNIESGSGKEHAALISALVELGLSIRFVSAENGKIVEVTPYDS